MNSSIRLVECEIMRLGIILQGPRARGQSDTLTLTEIPGWLWQPTIGNTWAFSLLLLSTAIVTFLLTIKWRFDGVFARNEYSLDY